MPILLAHRARRILGGRVAIAAWCALMAALPAAARPVAWDPPVNGLIVQLRDAPSHVAVARERVQGDTAASPLAQREATRWQSLTRHLRADSALARDMPLLQHATRRDPVGESAQVLRFERPMSTAEAGRVAQRLAMHPDVAWVVPNTRERRMQAATNPPNDPYFPSFTGQWWLQTVQGSNANTIDQRLRGVPNVLPAWLNHTTGASSAVVAVLDTGISAHPELPGSRILPGYDFVSDTVYANDGNGRDADPSDPGDWVDASDVSRDPARFKGCTIESSSWHGTIIAGLIAAQTNNAAGVAGMNWNGRILPVRVAGKCGADPSDIVDGMRWAAGLQVCSQSDGAGGCVTFAPMNANPARVVNISFGGSAACNALYQQAIDELRALPNGGAVVVAAGGNENGAVVRPASCQHVIGVGALNRDGFKTNYSNFGTAIVISTVGGDDSDGAWAAQLQDSGILTIGNGGQTSPTAPDFSPGYYYNFGTSFATPIVAGAVSLMLSVNPALTADQIIQGLRASARPHVTSSVPGFGQCSNATPGRCLCSTSTCGAGILDVRQALDYAGNPTGYATPAQTPADIDTPELRAAVALGPDRPPNTPVTPPPSTGGGGGGAMGAGWIVALALAAAALTRTPPFSRRRPRTTHRPAR
jgi:serine protease